VRVDEKIGFILAEVSWCSRTLFINETTLCWIKKKEKTKTQDSTKIVTQTWIYLSTLGRLKRNPRIECIDYLFWIVTIREHSFTLRGVYTVFVLNDLFFLQYIDHFSSLWMTFCRCVGSSIWKKNLVHICRTERACGLHGGVWVCTCSLMHSWVILTSTTVFFNNS